MSERRDDDLPDEGADLALALDPASPPLALRERLLRSAERGRFAGFVDRVAALIDQAHDAVAALLDRIDDAAAWRPGPAGARLIDLPAGAAIAGADAGFVRVAAGAPFPTHRHLGEERVLVLQGGYTDADGTVVRRGDLVVKPAGSEHAFRVAEGVDLVYVVVSWQGIEIDGVRVEV